MGRAHPVRKMVSGEGGERGRAARAMTSTRRRAARRSLPRPVSVMNATASSSWTNATSISDAQGQISFDPALALINLLFLLPFCLLSGLLLCTFHKNAFSDHKVRISLYSSQKRLRLDNEFESKEHELVPNIADNTNRIEPVERINDDQSSIVDCGEIKPVSALLPRHSRPITSPSLFVSGKPHETAPNPTSTAAIASHPPHDAYLFDNLHHAEHRVSLHRSLSLLYDTLILAIILNVVSWLAVLIWWRYIHLAFSILCSIGFCWGIAMGIGGWKAKAWNLSTAARVSLFVALLSFSSLIFFSTWFSLNNGLTFAAKSIAFVVVHLVAMLEVECIHEQEEMEAVGSILSLNQRSDERYSQLILHESNRMTRIRHTRAKALLGISDNQDALEELTTSSTSHWVPRSKLGDEEFDSKVDQTDAHPSDNSHKRIELPSHTHSFHSSFLHHSLNQRLKHRQQHAASLLTLRLVAYCSLLAYATAVYCTVESLSSTIFGAQYAGFLVSITIMALDLMLGSVKENFQASRSSWWFRLLVMLLSRALLLSIDETTWFLAYCSLYSLYAVVFLYLVIDCYVPYHPLTRTCQEREHCQVSRRLTLRDITSVMSQPEWKKLAAIKRSTASLATRPLLVLAALTCLFVLSMLCSYLQEASLDSSNFSWVRTQVSPSFVCGLSALALSSTIASSALSIRYLFFRNFKFTVETAISCFITQCLFVAIGLVCYYSQKSLIALILSFLVPILSFVAMYHHAYYVQLGVNAEWSWRLLASLLVLCCALLLMGIVLAEVVSTLIGWASMCALFVLLTSLQPALKYYHTLTLLPSDEWTILGSLVSLAALMYFLTIQLSLTSIQTYLLIATGLAYVILIIVIMGCVDYHHHRKVTSWNCFAFACLAVYAFSLGVISFAFVTVEVASCVCLLCTIIFLLLSTLMYSAATSFTVSKKVVNFSVTNVVLLIFCGILASYLNYHNTGDIALSFWIFSLSWLVFVVALVGSAIVMYSSHSSAAHRRLYHSVHLLPVYSFDLKNNVLSLYHQHIIFTCLGFLCVFVWSAVAYVMDHPNVAIIVLVSFTLCCYMVLRGLTLIPLTTLSPLVEYINDSMAKSLHETVWVQYLHGHEGDTVASTVVEGLKTQTPGQLKRLLHTSISQSWQELNTVLKHNQNENSESDATQLPQTISSTLEVDSYLNTYLTACESLQCLHNLIASVRAHTYFLVFGEATAAKKQEEAQFVAFCTWLKRNSKSAPIINANCQESDLKKLTIRDRQQLVIQIQAWQEENKTKGAQNTQNRTVEALASQRREQKLATRLNEDSSHNQYEDPYQYLNSTEQKRGSAPKSKPIHAIASANHNAALATHTKDHDGHSTETSGAVHIYHQDHNVMHSTVPHPASHEHHAKTIHTIDHAETHTISSIHQHVNHEGSLHIQNNDTLPPANNLDPQEEGGWEDALQAQHNVTSEDAGAPPTAQPQEHGDEEMEPKNTAPAKEQNAVCQASLLPEGGSSPIEPQKAVRYPANLPEGNPNNATYSRKVSLSNVPKESSNQDKVPDDVSQVITPTAKENNDAQPPCKLDYSSTDMLPLIIQDHEQAHALFISIQENYRSTGQRWVDHAFPSSESSLYIKGERDPSRPSAIHQAPVDSWRRPDEIVKTMLENGYDIGAPVTASQGEHKGGAVKIDISVAAAGFQCSDVVQGNIGTCYLLSALGVMAAHEVRFPDQRLLDEAVPLLTTLQYHAAGCYMLRFHRQHKPFFVLIDDQLPCQSNGLPAFSHCKTYTEIWVALIEKAYAKLSGCYESIEAGYIHQALADLTNGHCEELALHDENGGIAVNADLTWHRLQSAYDSGCMLGCGSNTGSNAQEVQGIVQGHAYAIRQVYSDSEVKLVQLFNPWGHGEWTGDWSDDSDKWTPFYLSKLTVTKEDDGTFWMDWHDFLLMYENLYLCRLLSHYQILSGAWLKQDGSAAGPREPGKNPQFLLSSNGQQTMRFELEQSYVSKTKMETEQVGYAYIQFYVVANQAQRINKLVRKDIKCWANNGKLCNTRTISGELEIGLEQVDQVFTIVCCCSEPNVETSFTLTVFSKIPVQFAQFP